MVVELKKSLGQHWLSDQASLNYIYDAANISAEDTILEIGPGSGNLTKLLAAKAKQLVAVELDSELIENLNNLNKSNLTVVNQSILEFDLNNLPQDYKIVANIPYYLTGKLIRQISEAKNRPSLVVLLVQKEIAERLSAKPGDLSILGLTCQYFWDIEKLQIISADKFNPPPKVQSQIIRLRPKSSLPLDDSQQKRLFQLIRIGFSSKRKTLLNNLSSGYKKDKEEISEVLKSNKLDLKIRPQNLSLNQWTELLVKLNI